MISHNLGKIEIDSDGDKIFEIVFNEHPYAFNVNFLKNKEKDEDWFISVISTIMTRIYEQGKKDERDKIKNDFKVVKDLLF